MAAARMARLTSITATGRLMLTPWSGFAAHEREVIRERSLAGSQRAAVPQFLGPLTTA